MSTAPETSKLQEFNVVDEFRDEVQADVDALAKRLTKMGVPFLLAGTLRMEPKPDDPSLLDTEIFLAQSDLSRPEHATWRLCSLLAGCTTETEVGFAAASFLQHYPAAVEGMLLALEKAGILREPGMTSVSPSVH